MIVPVHNNTRWEWAQTTGEFRAPKRGEFYVSGAIPKAYDAPNDLNTKYHIAVPIKSPPTTIVVDGWLYKLKGRSDV